MASLTTDWKGRSPYWVCCYTSAAGQRLKKSTKVRIKPLPGEKRKDGTPKTAGDKRAEAQDFCRTLEIAENNAKAGILTERAAKKLIADIVERTTGETLHNHTVSNWLTEWQAGKADAKGKSTAERYAQVVREFLDSLGTRSKLALTHITPKDIRVYRDAQLAAGTSNNTANDAVGIVSTAFNAALRQGYITNNPCTAVEDLPEETAERSTFTTEQVAGLVSNAKGDWKGAIIFAFYTGARLGDVANMTWTAIDLEKRLITFTPSKTKRSRKTLVIPLHADLERVLLEKPGVGKAFLFPSLAGRGTGGKTGLSGQFAKVMGAAGIVGTITRHTKEGRANNSLSFHSFRHSFNSAMANAEISQEVRMRLTGHSSSEMNKTYTHHELEPLRVAIEAIPCLKVENCSEPTPA
jgi:integrase